MAVTGRDFLNECHETDDEPALVRALRAVEPGTVQEGVGVLVKEIGGSAATGVNLGKSLGADFQTLDSIHRSGGPFDKGTTAEEYRSESRALKRRTLGLQPWKWFANRLSSLRNNWLRVTTAAKG